MLRKRHFLKSIEDKVVRSILSCADFLHDHVLLTSQLLRIEGRLRQDVRQYVERERHIGLQHTCKIARQFRARCSIQIPAHRLDCFRDLPRGAPLGTFESHVFEQMRNSMLVWLLVRLPDPIHTPSEAVSR